MSASKLPTARPPAHRTAPTRTTSRHDPTGGRRADADGSPLVLGRYRLQRRLGIGGYGTVWMARDERLEREVAVKILPRERIVDGRFEREARAAARLNHPGIVTLYEAAVDEHGAYLVSELIRGATLSQLLEGGRLSDRDVIAIAISLCDALAYAHSQDIVHRDVKPANVLIAENPAASSPPAKLTDFGVARVIGGDSLTRTGDVVGTAAYMAPEQAEGRETGAPADLYAVALITYEALTGLNPVRTSTAAVRARRLGAHLPPLRRQRRELPRELGRGVDLALRPRPRERGTLEELRAAFECSLSLVTDTPGVVGSPWPRPDRAVDRHERAVREAGGRARPARAASGQPGDQATAQDELETGDRPAWPARAVAATAAAGAAAWLVAHLLGPMAVAPAGAAIIAWLAVLLMPRAGWLGLTAALASAVILQGRPGGALVVVLAVLLPVGLLPRRGILWPVSAVAPTLGVVGLAGAWPAIAAGLGRTAWSRASLGATGYVWLLLAGPLAGQDLYVTRAPGTPSAGTWASSLSAAVHHVLEPIVHSGALAAAPVWAVSAMILPGLLKRRSLAVDLVLATVWAAVTVSASETAIAAAGGGAGASSLPTAVAGAVAAALLAISPTALKAWLTRPHSGRPHDELP